MPSERKPTQGDQQEQSERRPVVPVGDQVAWAQHETAEGSHQHAEEDRYPGQVHDQLKPQIGGAAREEVDGEGDEQRILQQVDDGPQHLDRHPDEEQRVHDARVGALQHTILQHDMADELARHAAAAHAGGMGSGGGGQRLGGHASPPT